MGQRIRKGKPIYNARPFAGNGSSLYGTVGDQVLYRNLRIPPSRFVKGTGGVHDIAADSVQKTARLGSSTSPATQIVADIPTDFASETVSWDLRHFRDDVENESDNNAILQTPLDANRDLDDTIRGTITLLSVEARTGGIVRIRFNYHPALDGLTPTTFTAVATAGPNSPADASTSYANHKIEYQIDTPALLDSAPYTYKLTATSGAISVDLLTGMIINADASGPPAPTNLTAEVK